MQPIIGDGFDSVCKKQMYPQAFVGANGKFHGQANVANGSVAVHGLILVYFTPNFWFSQGMDVALPPLIPGTLYLVATPLRN
jgi:hypothetical protein